MRNHNSHLFCWFIKINKKGRGGSKVLYSFLKEETIKVGTLSGGQVENV